MAQLPLLWRRTITPDLLLIYDYLISYIYTHFMTRRLFYGKND